MLIQHLRINCPLLSYSSSSLVFCSYISTNIIQAIFLNEIQKQQSCGKNDKTKSVSPLLASITQHLWASVRVILLFVSSPAGATRVLHPWTLLHHVPVCPGVADCGPQHSLTLLQHMEVNIFTQVCVRVCERASVHAVLLVLLLEIKQFNPGLGTRYPIQCICSQSFP